ncbi:hypothetical protein PQO03_02960 [Lentisphaera profundi]|uniref:EF-hand domain-containing protein n=1 Tax=Lentisphaera profundi TaxID=1658616 RepID=A0ABY7VT39_9BACT|nr:hypothetical protein [Lentisphaera profundi]WDE96919.1 hypothetical protein PQO03_02960 [Lentisphaera profundi]
MNKTLIFTALAFSFISSLHAEKSADDWKTEYFKKHPTADTNKDGELSWPEHKAHKDAQKALDTKDEATKTAGEKWKDSYFKKNPSADSNKDGELSWPEYNKHKKSQNI